jgi:4-aminobutyrate aminotransferase-like enzyme
MLPPLTVTAAEIEEAARILDAALRSVSVEEVKA